MKKVLAVGAVFACLSALTVVWAQDDESERGPEPPFRWDITAISPKSSTFNAGGGPLNGASGGRVNGLARADGSTFYAASEWGGLFKTRDGGDNWFDLEGHMPQATWDVEVDPEEPDVVYATSFYDGRAKSRAGINVSTDGGVTWSPAKVERPASFAGCRLDERHDMRSIEPSAFGIAIDPDDHNIVYVGTNCGLARSTDRGNRWGAIDPTPSDLADDVWDVVVHHGVIDICGVDGFQRSDDFGKTWSQPLSTGNNPPSGRCSIAASPEEKDVVFMTVAKYLYETNDGGASWSAVEEIEGLKKGQGRIPFVTANKRDGDDFDLYVGDIQLWRIACQKLAASVQAGRCLRGAGDRSNWTNIQGEAHEDVGDLAFADVGPNACPMLFANDGGVFHNANTTHPGCHVPTWTPSTTTTRALWVWDMSGFEQSGTGEDDIYLANQDNGPFAGKKSANDPRWAWMNPNCCDIFDVAAEIDRVVFTLCCYGPPKDKPQKPVRKTWLFVCGPGMANCNPLNDGKDPDGYVLIKDAMHPAGEIRKFSFGDAIANFAPKGYAALTDQGVFATFDISATPKVDWKELGSIASDCQNLGLDEAECRFNDVKVAMKGATPVFYVFSGAAPLDQNPRGRIFRYEGTDPTKQWTAVRRPDEGPQSSSGFGIFDVDPKNPDRLIASFRPSNGSMKMVRSDDGGTTWREMETLDQVMTGEGRFKYENQRGPADSETLFSGYAQPTLISFSPAESKFIVAGGVDSGVFLSVDDGANWWRLTNPVEPESTRPHIPRPRFAYWRHVKPGFEELRLYIGSQGRGVWRIDIRKDVQEFDSIF